ncbi:hypothetical protein C8R44DRAFT_872333 [Mycena epipterygia]|nr:hypothetical protein C8R44DRAFT_872333 [Mycena epipterygia]
MFLLLTAQENPAHQHLPDAGDNPLLHCIRQIRTSDSRARRRAGEPGRKTTTIPRIAGRTASPYDYPPQSLPHGVDHATNRARTCAVRSHLHIRGLRPTLTRSSSTCRRGTHVRTTAFHVNAHPALHDSGRQRAIPYRDAGIRSPPARTRTPNSTSTAPLLQSAPPDGRTSTSDVRFLSTRFIPHESPQSTPPRTTTPAIRTPAARAMRDSSAHAQRNPACASKACISSLSGRPLAQIQLYASAPALPTSPCTTAARACITLRSACACAYAYTVSAPQLASRDGSARQ